MRVTAASAFFFLSLVFVHARGVVRALGVAVENVVFRF